MYTILVVDDSAINRQVLLHDLTRRGYQVIEACDGREALQITNEQRLDLIVSDIVMPRLDGYQFVRLLRANAATADIPVIFYTASLMKKEAQIVARACGADHLLVKSTDSTILLATVEDTLSRPRQGLSEVRDSDNGDPLNVIAGQYADALGEARVVNAQLSELVETIRRLSVQKDESTFVQDFCDAAREVLDCEYAVVGIHQEDKEMPQLFFSSEANSTPVECIGVVEDSSEFLELVACARKSCYWPNGGSNTLPGNHINTHPLVRSFLALSVSTTSRVHGWLYLLNQRRRGEFSQDDERIAATLAAIIAVGLENGRLVGELRKAKEIEKRLLILEQHEDFTATLTHDLKNPLLGANRLLDHIVNGSVGSLTNQQSELLLQLKDGNAYLLSMIQNLIEVYRFEKDAKDLSWEEMSLPDLVQRQVEAATVRAHDAGIEIKTEISDPNMRIDGDRTSICRVLQNLLDNAVKFTPSGGTIKVTLSRLSEAVELKVHDTGPGICLEDQARLFQRFWQGAPGKKYTPSSGLGLYLCKQIVDAHHGEIICTSADKQGATFIVRLPIHRTDAEAGALPRKKGV